MSDAQIQALEEQLISELEKRAINQKVAATGNLVVRDILPYTDLGYTDNYWSVALTTATSYNAVGSDKDLDGKKVIGFMGFRILSAKPIVKLIKFSVGSGATKIKDIWQIEQCQNQNIVEGFTKEPVIYNMNDTINIDAWIASTTGTEKLVLLGKVAEPAGQQIMGGVA